MIHQFSAARGSVVGQFDVKSIEALSPTRRRVAAGVSVRIFSGAMTDDFSAEVTQDGATTVIHLRGDIDLATGGRLRDAIEPHLGPEQTIVLDFSEVTFCDSACLAVLVQARGRLTADGGSLVLRNPSGLPRRILTIAQAQGLIDIDIEDQSSDSN